jgi:hypothetical protein
MLRPCHVVYMRKYCDREECKDLEILTDLHVSSCPECEVMIFRMPSILSVRRYL